MIEVDDTLLERAVVPRQIVNVAYDDSSDPINGWLVRLRCGHEYWSPMPPAWRPIVCAECINAAITAMRAARGSADGVF